jgi:hypothetical protein
MLKALSPIQFGQLFIGEKGRVVLIEPKYLVPRGFMVYEDQHQFQRGMGTFPLIDRWTRVMENYGHTLSQSPERLNTLSALFRESVAPVLQQNLARLPVNFRENAMNTLRQGTTKAFNNGILYWS